MADYEVRAVPAHEVYPLRRALLHTSDPEANAEYLDDDHRDALHVGGFRSRRLVGVASITPARMPGEPEPGAWRLAGVAVDHGHRGYGLGAQLVDRCLEHAAASRARLVWAIVPAGTYGFFADRGLGRVGEPLVGDGGAPQYRVMARFASP